MIKNKENKNLENKKNDAPPHTKVCGLFGARFLDARKSPHLERCGFLQEFRHKKFSRTSKGDTFEVFLSHKLFMGKPKIIYDKRGWIRVVEAFVAILLIVGVLLFVINKGYIGKKDISKQVYDAEISVLREIELDDNLREEILKLE